jgi:hypothetical protein
MLGVSLCPELRPTIVAPSLVACIRPSLPPVATFTMGSALTDVWWQPPRALIFAILGVAPPPRALLP